MTSEKLFMEMADDCDDVPMGLLRHAARNRAKANNKVKMADTVRTNQHRYAATYGQFAIAVGQ